MTEGLFISLEGGEGVGKSTAMTVVADYLTQLGKEVVITREPGGTPLAETLRDMVLSHGKFEEAIDVKTELLLVFAARCQHVKHVILPNLTAGNVVLCDRFTDASFAYQGAGRDIDLDHIQYLADFIHADLWPDLTLLFDAPADVGFTRIDHQRERDRIEHEEQCFFDKVRACYHDRAKQYPKRYQIIDATLSIDEVKERVIQSLNTFFKENNTL